MDKGQILKLLHELGDELAEEQSYATINVCGGAAMAIAYNNLKSSDDIDSILTDFDSRDKFNECVKRVAGRHNLPDNWINEDVKIFVNSMKEMCFKDFGKFGTLSIRIISEEQLLAMKLFAARENKDLDDAVILVKSLNIESKEELNNILYKYFSDKSVSFMGMKLRRANYAEVFQYMVINKLKGGL
ncbi:MAG: DUF6036 family nucleotidyltransferase [Oscillospiraceae bacterium]|nr:DUF6036 family nucleotidyltransferase [Oscillospiraceae bacterium]